jgi:CheY-like chemotaxis protein
VLVVDDDTDVREAIIATLENAGLTTKAASSGIDALSLLRDGTTPWAIGLDLVMPGMSGMEVIAAIRADAALTHLPVIIVTAMTVPPTYPAVQLIRKPFRAGELLEAVWPLVRGEVAAGQ